MIALVSKTIIVLDKFYFDKCASFLFAVSTTISVLMMQFPGISIVLSDVSIQGIFDDFLRLAQKVTIVGGSVI